MRMCTLLTKHRYSNNHCLAPIMTGQDSFSLGRRASLGRFAEAIFIQFLQYARPRVMENLLAGRREVCQVCLLTYPSGTEPLPSGTVWSLRGQRGSGLPHEGTDSVHPGSQVHS